MRDGRGGKFLAPVVVVALRAGEVELTLPGLAQSVVLTRTAGRASAMPEGEKLAAFAATGAVLAIHLSIHLLDKVIAELTPHYGSGRPGAIVWRASWPDQRIVRATLATLDSAVGAELERTALILVGRTLGSEEFAESRLYAADYDRRYRPVGPAPRFRVRANPWVPYENQVGLSADAPLPVSAVGSLTYTRAG